MAGEVTFSSSLPLLAFPVSHWSHACSFIVFTMVWKQTILILPSIFFASSFKAIRILKLNNEFDIKTDGNEQEKKVKSHLEVVHLCRCFIFFVLRVS
jgi:hypothetical protein